MDLYKNHNKFEIKENNGSKLIFQGEKSTTNDYTKNLFNKIESNVKDYQSKNKPKVVPKSKPINPSSKKDPLELIKSLNELKEAGLITNKEFEDKKKELLDKI